MKRNKVHEELFRLTLPWHNRLDSHPALAVLLAPGLQTPVYARVLQQLHACLQPCEAALAAWERHSSTPACSAYQPRCAALARDLDGLGLPIPADLPALQVDSAATYLGLRYVLEGAALGSARIRQLLLKQAPDLHAGSLQYFAAQQAHVAQWPQFLQQLERLPDAETTLGVAAAAAVGVFTHFLATLDETAHG